MGYTISTHNGSVLSREHNIRNPKYCDSQEHIDKNGIHETWVDEKLVDAYKRVFEDAYEQRKAYNIKQGHAERNRATYLQAINEDKQKHACYEMIIQVGNRDKQLSAEETRQIYKEYIDSWKERNPNLELVGAYFHADEPNGTPHLHADYFPVAQMDKGMSVQNSLTRALVQQGIEPGKTIHQTPQALWIAKENKHLEDICRAHGLEIDHPKRENVKHMDTELFKAQAELNKTIDNYNDLSKENMVLKQHVERLQGDLVKEKELHRNIADKTLFGRSKNEITIPVATYRQMEKRIETKEALDAQKKELQIKNKQLNKERVALDQERFALEKEKSFVADREKYWNDKVNDLDSEITRKAEHLIDVEKKKLIEARDRVDGLEQTYDRAIKNVGRASMEETVEYLKGIKYSNGQTVWDGLQEHLRIVKEREEEKARELKRSRSRYNDFER